ncbi:MAG: tetratricopeptide repeat protein [Deltaproteobacteria bacterium]|nr:tetratricopeptide repeat protein [Deltaproteobacteria bacterium]MBI2348480.1 tetratricopeptide repeat protein [Deltaproteobacteria bacterium]MBI3061542.1 tetratricopeptide repeat protein [Deltaproteobacteria bacterium]
MQNRQEADESMLHGRQLLAQGDYEGSLRESQRTLSLHPDSAPADEAVFNMGLVYAHAGNPKKDYRKAMGFFRKLISEYPKSPLVEQAKAWVGVLQMTEKLSQTNEKLNQMLDQSKQVDIEIEERKRGKER